MTYRFGFEVEGFAVKNGLVVVPPSGASTDGFPGLLELRNTGGSGLYSSLVDLTKSFHELRRSFQCVGCEYDFTVPMHSFTGSDMAYLRKNARFVKDQVDIQNIYGKVPRRFGNKTLASFQINMSSLIRGSSSYEDKNGNKREIPESYGLLDVHRIVKAFDKEFAAEIKESNRQPGMYAIKDGYRLEYRSLPNYVFSHHIPEKVGDRIHKALKTIDITVY